MGYGGSEDATRALSYARALATGEDAMIIVVHIVQETTNGHADIGSASDDEDIRAKLTKLVGGLSHDGLKAIHKVVNYVGPQPAQGIADIAREVRADVIVVGTRGHSAIGGLVVGSVTQRLLHVAPCPVLAVPPNTRPRQTSATSKPQRVRVSAAQPEGLSCSAQ